MWFSRLGLDNAKDLVAVEYALPDDALSNAAATESTAPSESGRSLRSRPSDTVDVTKQEVRIKLKELQGHVEKAGNDVLAWGQAQAKDVMSG